VTNQIGRGTYGPHAGRPGQDFGHEDCERLLASLATRNDAIARVLGDARRSEVPVVFVNDHPGDWDSDARRIVADAL
jgi:hypothetical protein